MRQNGQKRKEQVTETGRENNNKTEKNKIGT